jgi:hypothetical protein
MNRKRYTSDPRYSAVLDNMDLLGITDVSTKRQDKNDTIVWKLPIKNGYYYKGKSSYIEVASFKAGYVRRQNGCYTPYQLNKRPAKEEYYKDYKTTWGDNGDYTQKWTGKYNKYTSKVTTKIPIEIDRLEYLISYCLKNYYIKHANFVAHGEYIPKWTHEWELKQAKDKYKKLDDFYESSKVFSDSMYEGRDDRVKELEKKLDEAQSTYGNNSGAMDRISDLESDVYTQRQRGDGYKEGYNDLKDKLDKAEKNEFYPYSMEIRVNGQKYKVV